MPQVFAAIGSLLATVGGGSALAGAATLGSLASTGVNIGETIANAGGPSMPPTPTTPPKPTAPTASQIAGANTTEANAQAAGGGTLAQNYLLSLLAGDPTGQNFGGAQPTGYGVNPSTITGLLGPNYGIPQ